MVSEIIVSYLSESSCYEVRAAKWFMNPELCTVTSRSNRPKSDSNPLIAIMKYWSLHFISFNFLYLQL